jgi:glycosyltransferase involved in cell wall biosynthesis
MKVSVIVPVYNGEKFIAGCLDGLMRQTYRDLEIIVVNDGSTDRSLEIAERYRTAVRIIGFEQNRGLSAARNAGMEAATGEYLHFLDVDDTVNDEFYERMSAAAAETDSDVACCGMVHQPKPHRTILYKEQRVLTTTDGKFRATKAAVWSYVCRYLFRVSMLKECGLAFEEGRLIEDMPFTVPAVYFANRIVLVPGAVYTYVLQPGSIMQNRDPQHRRRRHRDLRHAKELRHNFARKYGFRIPGVPTWAGPLSLLYTKWFT